VFDEKPAKFTICLLSAYLLGRMSFLRYFISIVCGALASSALGGLFACVVALVSPQFVNSLFGRDIHGSLVRYAAGVGMIWGLFLGTAAMACHTDSYCARD
jgi:hypothetical protein